MIKFIRETYYEKKQINIKNLIVSSIDLYKHNDIWATTFYYEHKSIVNIFGKHCKTVNPSGGRQACCSASGATIKVNNIYNPLHYNHGLSKVLYNEILKK